MNNKECVRLSMYTEMLKDWAKRPMEKKVGARAGTLRDLMHHLSSAQEETGVSSQRFYYVCRYDVSQAFALEQSLCCLPHQANPFGHRILHHRKKALSYPRRQTNTPTVHGTAETHWKAVRRRTQHTRSEFCLWPQKGKRTLESAEESSCDETRKGTSE